MTPYDIVYKAFLAEVKDDLYIVNENFPESEAMIIDDLTSLLNKAVVRFSYPRLNLRDKDDEAQEFAVDLDLEEIEILATGMVAAWARRELYNIDILTQTMTTKDYNSYSQAPHINALIRTADDADKRLKRMLIKYSIKNKDYTNRLDRLGR